MQTSRLSQPDALRLKTRSLTYSARPLVMGVLNATTDSFSDGGLYLDPARAEEHALRLEAEGADVLDLGGESSRPGSDPVTAEEECRRVLPVLARLKRSLKIPVSIDAYKPEVIERALAEGAEIVNDITGLADPRSARIIAREKAAVVVMHMRGTPKTMQQNTAYGDLVAEVIDGLKASAARALEAGIGRGQIAVDPGLGFGKAPEGNFELLASLGRIRSETGFPVCAGLSRKSFLKRMAGDDPAVLRSLNAAAHALALVSGASILRVHEPADAQAVIALYRSVKA